MRMAPADMQWIGREVFVGKDAGKKEIAARLRRPLQLWHNPPPVLTDGTAKPKPGNYFLRRLFFWMPRLMFQFDFKCPSCKSRSLHSKGIHNRVRLVLSLKDFYYICTEFLGCTCGKTFISTDNQLLNQLPY